MAQSTERYVVFKTPLAGSPYPVSFAKTLGKARKIMNELASIEGGDFYVRDSKEEVTVALASIRLETYMESWRGRESKLGRRSV